MSETQWVSNSKEKQHKVYEAIRAAIRSQLSYSSTEEQYNRLKDALKEASLRHERVMSELKKALIEGQITHTKDVNISFQGQVYRLYHRDNAGNWALEKLTVCVIPDVEERVTAPCVAQNLGE